MNDSGNEEFVKRIGKVSLHHAIYTANKHALTDLSDMLMSL